MEHKDSYDGPLIKYLMDEASPEEAAFVESWIGASEENRRYFEELKKTWLLVGIPRMESSIDHEWQYLKSRIAEEGNHVVAAESKKSYASVYRIVKVAAAASVIFLIGYWWLHSTITKPVAEQTAETGSQHRKQTDVARGQHINNGSEPMRFALRDGSEVVLFANSQLTYEMPDAGNYRHINLHGKAFFKVAKDKEKPFTVFSRNIATTALSTKFTITAYRQEFITKVLLHEGRVVVKPFAESIGRFHKEMYLTPGQELLFNNLTMEAVVHDVLQEKTPQNNKKTTGGANKTTYWYKFDQESLSEVFEQLKEMYKVDIEYDKKDVEKMYFIGTFNRDDSIHHILNQICTLNDLKMTRTNNRFIIKK